MSTRPTFLGRLGLVCFVCWCSPQSLGRVMICNNEDGSKEVKIKDSQGQLYSNTAPASSSATHSFNNVSVHPESGKTWGDVDFCDDLVWSCDS